MIYLNNKHKKPFSEISSLFHAPSRAPLSDGEARWRPSGGGWAVCRARLLRPGSQSSNLPPITASKTGALDANVVYRRNGDNQQAHRQMIGVSACVHSQQHQTLQNTAISGIKEKTCYLCFSFLNSHFLYTSNKYSKRRNRVILTLVSSQFDSNIFQLVGIPGRILVSPVTPIFRSKYFIFSFCVGKKTPYIFRIILK